MRWLYGVFLLSVSASVLGLTVIAQQGETVLRPAFTLTERFAVKPVTGATHWTVKPLQAKPIQVASLLHVEPNEFSEGHVTAHRLPAAWQAAPAFFVIGDDRRSLAWARANAKVFRHDHAIGLLASHHDPQALTAFERETHLVVLPVSLAGLAQRLHTHHWPFYVKQGWVLQ